MIKIIKAIDNTVTSAGRDLPNGEKASVAGISTLKMPGIEKTAILFMSDSLLTRNITSSG